MRYKCRYFYLDFVKVKIMEFMHRTDIPRGLINGLALFGKIHLVQCLVAPPNNFSFRCWISGVPPSPPLIYREGLYHCSL